MESAKKKNGKNGCPISYLTFCSTFPDYGRIIDYRLGPDADAEDVRQGEIDRRHAPTQAEVVAEVTNDRRHCRAADNPGAEDP